MARKYGKVNASLCWLALACLVVPMFASFFFDDMFSSISYLFENPAMTDLGWDAVGYGMYTSGYSVLCVFGGLVICGIMLDRWGVRITGSIFIALILIGALMVLYAIKSGFPPEKSLKIAYVGCMLFGLGSEIAGTAVTRSIAKWFKHGPMALAMGLQLSIARLGTALALVISPRLVIEQANHVYSVSEVAKPAAFGVGLIALGVLLWAVFVALDARFDKIEGTTDKVETAEEDKFKLSDVWKVLGNKNFILLALLCVLFYSSIVAFKKFAGSILIPRFNIPSEAAGWMVSMLPFASVIFSPVFGMLVDKKGKGTRLMIIGSLLAFAAHILLAFAPAGVPFFGYLSMVFLGFGYSLVPAALWPSVPKVVPEKVLGTAYSLVYWVQNIGLLSFKMLAGVILGSAVGEAADLAFRQKGAVEVELMFVGLCIAAILIAWLFARSSDRHPELRIDAPAEG